MEKNMVISIQTLLKGRGRNLEFDNTDSKRIKLIRHSGVVQANCNISQDYEGKPVYDLYRNHFEKFLEWQSEQKESNFNDVDFIVVFIGEKKYESRFVGVFKNCGKVRTTQPEVCIFDFQKAEGFEILERQIVIDWGKSAITWLQKWEHLKEVVRIEKESEKSDMPIFTRYEDVILTFPQLQKVITDHEWKSRLEVLNCVYLILDKNTGKQYVGVTYKDLNPNQKNGILGRWSYYAQTGHGDNKLLMELLRQDPDYARKYFQWTILETLPLNVTPKEAIDRETIYKEKFGTRDFGYNKN